MNAAEYRLCWKANAPVPYGFCWCGCSGKPTIASRNMSRKGMIKGEPMRRLPHHFSQGLFEPQKDDICRRYQNGEPISSIKERFGVSSRIIIAFLKRRGIQIRPSGDSLRYTCDDSFFSVIDSEEQAYWLGFLAANGCVQGNRLQVCLSSRDRQHLVHLASCLRTNAPIKDYFIGGVYRSEFRVTSKQLVCDLGIEEPQYTRWCSGH